MFIVWPPLSSASSRVPGRPAAGRAVPGPSGGASSARCCSPSPRRWPTCPTTSAMGSNPQPASPVTASPALVITVMDKMGARRRMRRRRMTKKSSTTGSMTASQSAPRLVVEVWAANVPMWNMFVPFCEKVCWLISLLCTVLASYCALNFPFCTLKFWQFCFGRTSSV